jgi:hypothetical protein
MRTRAFRTIAWGFFVFALTTASAVAQPITSGNILIYRVGTPGGGALTSAASAVFLDEYTTTGSLVQSFSMPTTGASALTASGNATTEGILTRSQDGSRIVFTGYRRDAGLSNPSSQNPTTTARVIANIDASGVFSTAFADTAANNTIRSATSIDGVSQYYLGTAVALRYVATPSAASSSVIIDARNSREALLSGNTLFASNGSTAVTAKIQSYGILPTTTTTPTPVATLLTTDAINGFIMLDLNPLVSGDDTIYALSTVENLLRKYTFDGTNWNANGSIAGGGGLNVTGSFNGTNVNLFITSATSLFAYTDSTGIGGSLTGSLGAALATAATDTGFRGIAIAPIPEPSSFVMAGIVVMGAIGFRKRRT